MKGFASIVRCYFSSYMIFLDLDLYEEEEEEEKENSPPPVFNRSPIFHFCILLKNLFLAPTNI